VTDGCGLGELAINTIRTPATGAVQGAQLESPLIELGARRADRIEVPARVALAIGSQDERVRFDIFRRQRRINTSGRSF
jgi:hypothetical protein